MFRLAAILALAASPVFAEPVHLSVKAPAGSIWVIEANFKQEKSSSAGSRTTSGRAVYRAELRGEGEARRLVVTTQPAIASQAFTPVTIEYEVDNALTPRRVVNWDGLQRTAIEAAEKSGLSGQLIEQTRTMFSKTSAEDAAHQLVPALPWISEGQGANLEIGRASRWKDVAAPHGPDGDDEIAFTLVSLDATAGRAVVTFNFRRPPQPVTEDLRAQFRKMVDSTNPKASTVLPEKTGELSQTCRFDIDVATGLARRTECDTVGWNLFVNGGGGGMERQTEHWSITQTLPE